MRQTAMSRNQMLINEVLGEITCFRAKRNFATGNHDLLLRENPTTESLSFEENQLDSPFTP